MGYPCWVKPVNSFSSYLGFRIENDKQLFEKLGIIRDAINAIAKPYDELLEKVSLPYDLRDVGGQYCIAEQIIAGEMSATCGYVFHGEIEVYGMVDVVRLENNSTLSRLRYPSALADKVQQKAIAATKEVIAAIGFDNAAFHVEWMYDEANDQLWLVEINPRISQSHGELFRLVDGESDMAIPIDIGLNSKPQHPHGKGAFAVANKYYWRVYDDALVESVPSQEEIEALQKRFPDVCVHLTVKEGETLSERVIEDSYTYCIAEFYLGAENEEALLEKIEACKEMLTFHLNPIEESQAKRAGSRS